MAKWSI